MKLELAAHSPAGCSILAGLLWLALLPHGLAQQAPQTELRTAAAVRALNLEMAAHQPSVRLRGIVTFFDERLYSRFVQDETAGIYLQASTQLPPLVPGQLVEIEGRANPGEYTPVVLTDHVRVLGRGDLPAAQAVTYDQLATGEWNSLFVEITGIVRAVQFQEAAQVYEVEIATGGGRLSAFVRELPVAQSDAMLASTVRVRGVCSVKFNHQRQSFAVRLMVPRQHDLTVVVPAPEDPYAAADQPVGSLLQFSPKPSPGQRQKVTGTVTLVNPGKFFVLQNDRQGVEVQSTSRGPLTLGDRVEALGFFSQSDYTPALQDAVYRKVADGAPLPPGRMTPHEVLKGKHDCRLIQIEAQLLDRAELGAEPYLVLQSDGFIFGAYYTWIKDRTGFAALKSGSRVLVTGVCRIDPGEWAAGENWRARSFRLDLRSLEDVRVIKAPSWWTLRRLLWIAGALALALLAAFAWVAALRRQVAERTRELESQIQQRQLAERRRELAQERARVAHDLHDDHGARLTEVNMLAALAKSPATSAAEKEKYLNELTETARQMVTSLDEIVWAINPRNDTVASLASYFASYSHRLLDLAGIPCGLDIAEDLPEHPLDTRFRQEIFCAFKEALSNLIRHSQATRVWLRVAVRDQRLTVELEDNGRGFKPTEQPPGHDGLANMAERLQSLDGTCEITSTPNAGTIVRLQAPLPGRTP